MRVGSREYQTILRHGRARRALPPGPCVNENTMSGNAMSGHAAVSCRKAGGEQMGTHKMTGTQSYLGGGGSGKTR